MKFQRTQLISNSNMRHLIFILCFIFIVPSRGQFLDSFTISYVKKTNLHKALGDEPWTEQMKKVIPKYVNDQYLLTYKNGISFYKGVVSEEDKNKVSQTPEWLHAGVAGIEIIQTKDSFRMRKEVMDVKLQIVDTAFKFNWKINGTDKRTIAGYSCRKAVATFNDSILIYAFYAEELMAPVGPEAICGLPGAILGVGIPKYNVTWFANKVEVHANGFQAKLLPKKKEKTYSLLTFKNEMKSIWGGRWDKRGETMFWKMLF